MSPEGKPTRRVCSIADALSIVGDRYALLVARELRYGRTRFQDIAAGTGAPRDVLTAAATATPGPCRSCCSTPGAPTSTS